MEEKIIIEGKKYNVKRIVLCVFIVPLIFTLIMIHSGIANYDLRVRDFNNHYHDSSCQVYNSYYSNYSDYLWDSMIPECRYSYFSTGEEYATAIIMENEISSALTILGFGIVVCFCLFLMLKFYTITVTDKRIYGRLAFGKRVDLPIDFVTSVAKIQGLKGITVLSSSKKRKFILIKNVNEIYNEINNLLIERQKKQYSVVATIPTNTQTNNTSPDDLIKLKELLDMGVITQEEFDAKKKQLLNL